MGCIKASMRSFYGIKFAFRDEPIILLLNWYTQTEIKLLTVRANERRCAEMATQERKETVWVILFKRISGNILIKASDD